METIDEKKELFEKDQLENIKSSLKREQRNLLLQRIKSNKLIITGVVILLTLVLLAIVGPLISSYNPYEMEVEQRLEAPSSAHILGTDNFGRDLFSRLAYGAKTTLGVGLIVTLVSSVFGMIIGLYASFYRTLDHVLMRICDGLMSIPAILLAIALMAALGAKTENVIIAMSVVFTPYVARVIRSAALVVKKETYIEAMRAQGASDFRIIWLHVMPNTVSPLIIQSTFIFADAIIAEAALSFLGAGVPPPDPSWGNILYDGKLFIFNAWWMTIAPGILIVLSVLGLNLLGDGLRDLIDPHTNYGRKKKKGKKV